MKKNNKKSCKDHLNQNRNETLNNDFYYRDQEMMRPIIESEIEEKDEESE